MLPFSTGDGDLSGERLSRFGEPDLDLRFLGDPLFERWRLGRGDLDWGLRRGEWDLERTLLRRGDRERDLPSNEVNNFKGDAR